MFGCDCLGFVRGCCWGRFLKRLRRCLRSCCIFASRAEFGLMAAGGVGVVVVLVAVVGCVVVDSLGAFVEVPGLFPSAGGPGGGGSSPPGNPKLPLARRPISGRFRRPAN